jgi:hypothetical protein
MPSQSAKDTRDAVNEERRTIRDARRTAACYAATLAESIAVSPTANRTCAPGDLEQEWTIDLLNPTLLWIAAVVAFILFAVVAFLTRATRRRAVGALVASIPIVPMVMLLDLAAARLGWWSYPSIPRANVLLPAYIATALWYGAALGLIGWRVIRRFGGRGLLAFLALFGLYGAARDHLFSSTTGLIVFGSGALPRIADFLAYASGAAVVQLLMLWIVGRPGGDPLARRGDRPQDQRN